MLFHLLPVDLSFFVMILMIIILPQISYLLSVLRSTRLFLSPSLYPQSGFKALVHRVYCPKGFQGLTLETFCSSASISAFQDPEQIKHTHHRASPNSSPPSPCFIRSLHDLPQKPSVWPLENNKMVMQLLQSERSNKATDTPPSAEITKVKKQNGQCTYKNKLLRIGVY